MQDNSRKKRVFDIIQIGQRSDFASRFFDFFIVTAIILNILALFLGTFQELESLFPVFHAIEGITIAIFCVEYALRIWTAEYLYPHLTKKQAVLRFLVSFDGVVDLLTILPFFYLSGFVAFRMLRVVRIFHLFRLNSHYDSFNVITSVLLEKKNQIISSVFIIFVLMLASSLCMFSVEHDAQPELFRNAFSGIWWSLSTIFTVGYGDIYPVTVAGRIIAVIITFLGVGVVAIPTGIISAGFVENYTRMKQEDKKPVRHMNTVNMILDANSPYTGKTVHEMERMLNMSMVVIIRNGSIAVPADNARLLAGDVIVYQTDSMEGIPGQEE